jgi:hypothetical protein
VKELSDHDLLYSSLKSINAFDFLLSQTISAVNWNSEETDISNQFRKLAKFFKKNNYDWIYYNLTPCDLEPYGLYTARVIISEFQPIYFGTQNIRLGGNRLFKLPYEMGLREKPSSLNTINQNPHPLA